MLPMEFTHTRQAARRMAVHTCTATRCMVVSFHAGCVRSVFVVRVVLFEMFCIACLLIMTLEMDGQVSSQPILSRAVFASPQCTFLRAIGLSRLLTHQKILSY